MNGISARYSSDEISGNESNDVNGMSEMERQADFNRHREEMKRKRRRKKRTSSSVQSSCFQGLLNSVHLNDKIYSVFTLFCILIYFHISVFTCRNVQVNRRNFR